MVQMKIQMLIATIKVTIFSPVEDTEKVIWFMTQGICCVFLFLLGFSPCGIG